jgi:YD repeat-containing protein
MKIARMFLSALILFVSCSLLVSQTAPAAAGTPAFGTYTSGPDVINVGNLNVHLTIPILNKQGRAGMNFIYNLTYDNSIWQQAGVNGNLSWQPVGNWGWGGLYQSSYVTYTMTTSAGSCGQYGQYQWQSWTYTNLTYVDSTGGTHPTNFQGSYVNSPSGSSYCPPSSSNPPPNMPVTTSDNSGYTIYPTVSAGSLSAYVTDKYAQTYYTPSYANGGSGSTEASYSATDANGNEISGVNGLYTDTTGKTALTVAGSSPNPMTFKFPNPSGGTSTVTVNFSTTPVTIRTNFGCSGVAEYQASNQYLVSSIVLPDNSEYTFSYEATPGYSADTTGRIASITLPSGGTITYQYTNSGHPGGISCTDDGNTYIERSLSAGSGSSASTVTYARAANGGTLPSGLACSAPSCTEVVDGYGNYSEYNFIPPYIPTTGPAGPLGQYYETSRKVYQGSASGTPVLARTTCYNGATNCTATSLTFPVSSIDTSNTLNGIETDGATADYDSNGNFTGQTTYDFASGANRGGTLTSETITYGYSIKGLRTLDTTTGGGSTIAKTEYDYDQGTPVASSGVPQHTSVSGARGNLTTVKHYLSSSTSIAQSFTYEDTGSVLTSTDPSGATTTNSYDSTFVYNQGVSYPTPSRGSRFPRQRATTHPIRGCQSNM